jgi:exopolyphosphatase/guanosine-5'-triphosphate,3'-diphosphate pyrophosphatase
MRVAAIDCGTNSIRLLIADITNGKFQEIHRDMEIVRLGEGVDKNRAFAPTAIERTLKAVEKYKAEITRRAVERIRFCATSATRDASNRDLFIDGVKRILNVDVEVIPGTEEARLSFKGATQSLPVSMAPFLVVDIGGGSTEFVLADSADSEKLSAVSVNIGCVRMSERHFKDLPPKPVQISAAISDINSAIEQAGKVVDFSKAKSLIAVAGTATTVAAAALNLDKYDRYAIHLAFIESEKAASVSQKLLQMNRSEISALPYMHPGRVDVISAGALVLTEIIKSTKANGFIAAETDILDGIAWSLAK